MSHSTLCSQLFEDTTQGKYRRDRPLPADIDDRLAKLSFAGFTGIVTGYDGMLEDLQVAHILAQATRLKFIRALEQVMGIPVSKLNLHCVSNVCFMQLSTHLSFDEGEAYLSPTKEILERVWHAVNNCGLPLGQTTVPPGVATNEAGYVPYDMAIPDGIREYDFVPVVGEAAWCPCRPVVRQDGEEHTVYKAPFEGVNRIPALMLHLNPYFVVMHAYGVLVKDRESPVTIPEHVREQADLIKKIGERIHSVAHTWSVSQAALREKKAAEKTH
ncbi:hypothetical protein BD626DRAFT_568864 [Schizophyllum amplum]|uniref:HNH nuclease domain-containing protein n=1 Tax=Schizophyllum amplum TaxID=97359 RepID=A0A550CF84_9AGAR|nr:hypothetical protein BD626DRAFT_568864 [Auriculariopsis ampla]